MPGRLQERIALVVGAGTHASGCYHIQNVNGYMSRLEGWLRPFNGVATNYLKSCLGWRRMIERDGERLTPRHCLAGAMG